MTIKVLEQTPRIETERLVLRKFTKADAPSLFTLLRDREVNTYLPWFVLQTLEEAEVFLEEQYLNHYAEPGGYRYAVCLRTDDIPIGYVQVGRDDSYDLGYGLSRRHWGKGIMTEACRAVVSRVKAAGYPYVTATHDRNNPGSGSVMQKLGMTYRYSYEEQWMPKNLQVTFRMYQLDFTEHGFGTYPVYWDRYPVHYVEESLLC